MSFIDTHAHLYLPDFAKDAQEIIARAEENNVKYIYLPNIDHQSIDAMLEWELKFPNCMATMGLHPCSVKKDFEKELYIVEDWLKRRKFVAIGEMGTDLYWDTTFFEQQKEAFRIQANWAKEYSLPLIIHCRNSIDETIELVEELQSKEKPLFGIFHCFSGSLEQAQKIIDLGFYLGIGGVVTFKKSGLDEVLKHLSLENLVLETDSPYLAPTPHRGKRNESSYIPLIAEKIASMYQVSIEKVAQHTTENTKKIFSKKSV
ncbi:MAG: TatD family hydrolase [Raineya sp.]